MAQLINSNCCFSSYFQLSKILLLIAPLLILIHIDYVSAWSASSVIDVAADLFEPGDDSRLINSQKSDPLTDYIRQHDRSKNRIPTSNKIMENENFLVPMLTGIVGDNNQLIEYMGAATIARATNRTLCLTPFFSGPSRHTPQSAKASLKIEERYDIGSLHKFVKVSSLEQCFKSCNKHIDGFWRLRASSSSLGSGWKWDEKNVKSHDLGWSYVNWTSIIHVKQVFESFDDEKCVAMGGLFPGFRWRGAYLAPSLFIRPSSQIIKMVDYLQQLAMISNGSYLAVHWRFEESLCKNHGMGLCFPRCGDGSVIDSGLHPNIDLKAPFSCRGGTRGVVVSKEDIMTSIYNKAQKENLQTVYLATDGWIRGSSGKALVKEVVEGLRKQGLAVVGLWKIEGLPNFPDGKNFNNQVLGNRSNTLSGHMISEVEQEMCVRAKAFMGSGQSTWSLSVFRERLAVRKKQQLISSNHSSLNVQEIDDFIVENILSDSHAAGMQCMYRFYFNRARLNTPPAQETYEEEVPDSWLDVDACEGLLKDGHGACKLNECLLH